MPKTLFLEALVKKIVNEVFLSEATPPPVPADVKQKSIEQANQSKSTDNVSLTPLGDNWEVQGDVLGNAKKVLKAFEQKLSQSKGIPNSGGLKVMGVGTKGVAFDTGDKVLKVTSDPTEAKTSGIIAGKNIPNIVQIYDIWKFPGIDWWGILQEKLAPLPPEEAQEINKGLIQTSVPMSDSTGNPLVDAKGNQSLFIFPQVFHHAGSDWNKALKLFAELSMKKNIARAYKSYPEMNPANGGPGLKDPKITEFVRTEAAKAVKVVTDLMDKYKMRPLFKTLSALGIKYYDFHGGNYAKRPDGSLVLIDLGRSISQGKMPAELQEAFNSYQAPILG